VCVVCLCVCVVCGLCVCVLCVCVVCLIVCDLETLTLRLCSIYFGYCVIQERDVPIHAV